MPYPYQAFTVRPQDGGDLVTQLSYEDVGINNYVEKLDWRREYDREVRREGDLLFRPNLTSDLGNQPTPANPPDTPPQITLIKTGRRANGEARLFVGTPTALYIYHSTVNDSVFQRTGANAPVFEESGSNAPVFSIFDAATWTQIGSGFSTSGHRWEMENVAGEVIFNNGVDLPQMYNWGTQQVEPIYELRENGIASVGTIAQFNGLLVLADISEIFDSALADWMNGGDPYGVYTDTASVNRIRYRIIWSSVGSPDRFGSVYKGSITTGTTSLTLDYPVASLRQFDQITILGAGENGADLIAIVQSISGTSVTIDTAAQTTVTDVDVFKTDISELNTAGTDLQDDSTGIIRMAELKSRLIVFKESSIFSGRYTSDAANLIVFSRTYVGPRVLFWKWTMTIVNGEYLLFAGKSKFYTYDAVSEAPAEHPKLSMCDNLFFDDVALSEMDSVFAAENQIVNEVWFFYPTETVNKAITYDYLFNTCATVGKAYTAAGTVQKPFVDGDPDVALTWFVLGDANGTIWQYFKTSPGTSGWTRNGDTYDSILKSGLGSGSDDFNEKDLRSYVVCLSYPVTGELEAKLYATRNPSEAPTLLFTRVIASPGTKNIIPVFYRNNYFQYRLRVTDEDINYSLSRQIFEYSGMQSKSNIRKQE